MSSDPARYAESEIEAAAPKLNSTGASGSTVLVTATFVAEPLEAPLGWVLAEAGLACTIGFAPYNQVFQQLLTPHSELARNVGGPGVLLVRLEDFVRDQTDLAEARQSIARVSAELGDAIEQFAKRAPSTLVVAVFGPAPTVDPDLRAALAEHGRSLLARLEPLAGVQILEEGRIGSADAERYDAARDRLAHVPFTETYYASLALALARRIHAIRVPAAKVLVLDCDNTLWRGVVGEDGVDGIEISEPYAAVQDFAVRQLSKGILICLASKNTEADVLEVFARRPDMRLRAEHVVAHRINWLPKPANLRSLALELNLGLDAFVFFDDNPLECAQMRAELPEVATLQLPSPAEIPRFLENLWIFDKVGTTAEDANRTRMYRENSARKAMESSVEDIGQFLAALDLKIDIAVPSDDEWTRVEQLGQRTNQFNFTTRRRTALELKSVLANGGHVFRVRVSDRFGDYGLVGELAAVVQGTNLLVDTFLLSCRVLGRGVEHAMLRRLGELAEAAGLEAVLLPYIATARNVPARAFADSVASQFAHADNDGTLYRLPAAVASQIAHRPGHDPAEIVEARLADEKKPGPSASANKVVSTTHVDRSERYARLATVVVSGSAVLAALAARNRQSRSIDLPAVGPSSSLETQLLLLWEEVLEIDGLGIDDDFFALGGTSLLSVKLFAEIGRRFGSHLRLTTILDAPTVRTLAVQVARSADQVRTGVVCLRRGGDHNLFLVHDGFGETLLYLNLAKLMPSTMSVYGIEPRRLPGIPLAHASIEDMAAFYVNQIRSIQPQGPYWVGGMCAGGVIAYEMAACLLRHGEQVQRVTILDGATPQAAKRTGRSTSDRLSRLEKAVAVAGESTDSTIRRWASMSLTVSRKVYGFVIYKISFPFRKASVHLRFRLMRNLVKRNAAWPRSLPELNVMEIYNLLESRYIPPPINDVPVLLVRASRGDGMDTPYREVYQEEDFGWRRVAPRLDVVDVTGGHSSMLQERAVPSLAAALVRHMAASPVRQFSP
jgi:FkbH-like protein